MARVRTFLGIDVGAKIRNRLVALQEDLALDLPQVKWVEPDNLHVTLLFLGEVDQREVLDICRAAQKAVVDMPAFTMSVEGTGCFPNARRPHVVWVGVGKGVQEVCAVHDAIEKPLVNLGCYRREARAFTPHVTLGRIRGEAPGDAVAQALAKHSAWNGGEVLVRDVHVMSSELTGDGPIYTVMSRAKLSAE
jgi:2'-5' RNA ligase